MFDKFARQVGTILGHAWVFAIALFVLIVWGISGPLFGFSDTWQLVINTGTTIVTFLMVFIIQNTQNRDNMAINAKLDALVKYSKAQNSLIGVEDKSQQEIERVKQ
jgi:low affinity Fe/Cu permease